MSLHADTHTSVVSLPSALSHSREEYRYRIHLEGVHPVEILKSPAFPCDLLQTLLPLTLTILCRPLILCVCVCVIVKKII